MRRREKKQDHHHPLVMSNVVWYYNIIYMYINMMSPLYVQVRRLDLEKLLK